MAQISQGKRVPTASLQKKNQPVAAKLAPETAVQEKKVDVDPEILLEATGSIMQEISDLMEEEMRYVRQANVEGIQRLLKRKNMLIEAYQSNLAAIKADPQKFKACAQEKRDVLKDLGRKMESATHRNTQALEAAITATRGLIDSIIKSIRAQVLPTVGYGRLGSSSLYTGPEAERLCPAARVKKSV